MSDEDSKTVANPLYGAPVCPPTTAKQDTAPAPIPDPADNGAGRMKADTVPLETTNPLFGATPGPAHASTSSSFTKLAAPAVPHRSARLPLSHPSPLPAYLRKLGYVLSLVLGSSAVIAGIWSVFLLPLLHASFSARKALVENQTERWKGLVEGLKRIRQTRLYDSPTPPPGPDSDAIAEKHNENEEDRGDEEARLTQHHDEGEEYGEIEGRPMSERLIAITPLATLTTRLSDLASALTSVETTRMSLLSTVEAYTTYLHRQIYIRPQPLSRANGYGLNTLSANLAKAGGGAVSAPGWSEGNEDGVDAAGVKAEEWDAVRKEVRAIKGMLLSRRNFAPADSEAR